MKFFVFIILLANTCAIAQKSKKAAPIVNDTIIVANTEPAYSYRRLQNKLEEALSKSDTVGRRYTLRLDNIGFIVSKTGTIDSAWVIFHKRPIHTEIIKLLKQTPWKAAKKDGQPITSHQELRMNIYLTKATLKRYDSWPPFLERLLTWWAN